MSNFWVKIAIFAVIIAGLVVLVKKAAKSTVEQIENTKTIGEVWEEDERRARAEPNILLQETEADVAEQQQEASVEPAVEQPKRQVQKRLQFRELDEIEEAEAVRLFEVAIQYRKMGRMGRIGYKTMVDCCRQLIEKFPGSVYEYKARRMLGELPKHVWDRYKVTEREVNPKR